MNMPAYLDLAPDHRIAYHRTLPKGDGASRPGIVFLGGFRSDMTGVKATWLESWARNRGVGYLRFDYRGHGASSGDFAECTLGMWARDATEVISHLAEGRQILVGSSMGGWIAALMTKRLPERVAGLVGIATATDFIADNARNRIGEEAFDRMMSEGQVEVDSAYSDEPYLYTRQLFEEAHQHLIFKAPFKTDVPVRLLHGTADVDVPHELSARLLSHMEARDARLTLVKGADHRFSGPDELALIGQTVEDVLGRVGG